VVGAWDSVPGKGRDLFPRHPIQINSGSHPLSNPVGTAGSALGAKATGASS
jgi:hypothetical protein